MIEISLSLTVSHLQSGGINIVYTYTSQVCLESQFLHPLLSGPEPNYLSGLPNAYFFSLRKGNSSNLRLGLKGERPWTAQHRGWHAVNTH